MVLLIIIPMKNGYFIGNIPYFQTNPHGDLTMKTLESPPTMSFFNGELGINNDDFATQNADFHQQFEW